jgi:hypothetical protein
MPSVKWLAVTHSCWPDVPSLEVDRSCSGRITRHSYDAQRAPSFVRIADLYGQSLPVMRTG